MAIKNGLNMHSWARLYLRNTVSSDPELDVPATKNSGGRGMSRQDWSIHIMHAVFWLQKRTSSVHLVYLKHTEAYCHWRKRNSNKNSSDQKDHKFLQMTALLQILRQLAISPNTWSTVETPWASKCILCTPCNLFSIRFTNQIRTLNPYPKFISWYRTLSTRAYLWLIQITFDVETQTV